ncbi:hypothetical protein [Mesobacillus foraminis]|uniref:hypothetical protein n=1 Tax=Mesobacillus foraminis TaxID=279826 RepID=UPI000EF50A07|nr:hypothetical protein [Mesobacillus foraminis]
MSEQKSQVDTPIKKNAPPSTYGGMSPNAGKIPGDSIDEHRNIETANIILSGNEIHQQNENQ